MVQGHYLTFYFDKQSSVRARIDFAQIPTNAEAGVVQSQAMTPCFFHIQADLLRPGEGLKYR
jgi:hypothetical protein